MIECICQIFVWDTVMLQCFRESVNTNINTRMCVYANVMQRNDKSEVIYLNNIINNENRQSVEENLKVRIWKNEIFIIYNVSFSLFYVNFRTYDISYNYNTWYLQYILLTHWKLLFYYLYVSHLLHHL